MAKNKTAKEVYQNDNAEQDEEEMDDKPSKKKSLPGADFKKKVLKVKEPWNKGEWKANKRI